MLPKNLTSEQDLTVAILLDRSGSMESVRDATIDAFNAFMYELRMDTNRTLVTLTQFDSDGIDTIHDARDVTSVPPLTRETYVPRAMTPLFDAAGAMLARTEKRAPAGGSVLCVFITDGHENASREWTRRRIFDRIKELEARDWAFMYLGAHADAYAEADSIGIAKGNQARWDKSSGGAAVMADTLGKVAYGHRTKTRKSHELILDREREMMERGRRR
jgi:hypothetical protein